MVNKWSVSAGVSDLARNRARLALNGTNLFVFVFLDEFSVDFVSMSKNVLKTHLKNPRCAPFGPNLNQFRDKSDIPGEVRGCRIIAGEH